MSKTIHQKRFPNEGDDYRRARDELLRAEIDLREHIQKVAELRGQLPDGGRVKEDYLFSEHPSDAQIARDVRLSELFAPGKDSLLIYSYMYAPDNETPCPGCTSLLDGLDGCEPHISQRVNVAVVAKSPAERLATWARGRGWRNLRLLSSAGNSYNDDYFAQNTEGVQLPACNVFVRRDSGIHHFWSAELLYAPLEGHPRHVDLLWPIWNVMDLTPEGRDKDWSPKLSYQ